jgi:hypothetical protein
MSNQVLFSDTYLTLYYHESLDCIYADWIGFQNLQTVQDGCERLLEAMVEKGCTKVLNDNTHVEGIWSSAAEWVGVDWFPRIRQAGMKCFAWVYSPSAFSRLSTDKCLRFTNDMDGIRIFDQRDEAEAWLAGILQKSLT